MYILRSVFLQNHNVSYLFIYITEKGYPQTWLSSTPYYLATLWSSKIKTFVWSIYCWRAWSLVVLVLTLQPPVKPSVTASYGGVNSLGLVVTDEPLEQSLQENLLIFAFLNQDHFEFALSLHCKLIPQLKRTKWSWLDLVLQYQKFTMLLSQKLWRGRSTKPVRSESCTCQCHIWFGCCQLGWSSFKSNQLKNNKTSSTFSRILASAKKSQRQSTWAVV